MRFAPYIWLLSIHLAVLHHRKAWAGGFDFRWAMDNGKILLCHLLKGALIAYWFLTTT